MDTSDCNPPTINFYDISDYRFEPVPTNEMIKLYSCFTWYKEVNTSLFFIDFEKFLFYLRCDFATINYFLNKKKTFLYGDVFSQDKVVRINLCSFDEIIIFMEVALGDPRVNNDVKIKMRSLLRKFVKNITKKKRIMEENFYDKFEKYFTTDMKKCNKLIAISAFLLTDNHRTLFNNYCKSRCYDKFGKYCEI